jgi:hypothetical protein
MKDSLIPVSIESNRAAISVLFATTRIAPTAAARARVVCLELPQEVRIRLVGQYLRDKLGAGPQIPALLEHLRALNIDLTPSRLDQPGNARTIHVLLKSSPPDGASTHGTTLRVRIQRKIFPSGDCFGRRELVCTVGIGENVGAIACRKEGSKSALRLRRYNRLYPPLSYQ